MKRYSTFKPRFKKLTPQVIQIIKKDMEESAISVQEVVQKLQRAKEVDLEILKRRFSASRETETLLYL